MRRIAARHLRRERPHHTLQPTALVNETFLRLVQLEELRWRDRAHFFNFASRLMRRVLIDSARSYRSQRRGGGIPPESLDAAASVQEDPADELVALDEALAALAEIDPPLAHLVELRHFVGLGVEETAAAMGCSTATVTRRWIMARAWLFRHLEKE